MKLRNQKVEDFCNALIEPGYVYDELAITIVCKMKNVHCLVLCNNSFWTTRSKFDFRGCAIKLCYLGGGVFKDIAPKFTGGCVTFGTTKKNFTVQDRITDIAPLSTDLNVGHTCDNFEENPSGSMEQDGPVDQPDTELQEDLEGTGLLPDDDAAENVVQNSVETSVEESVQDQAGPTRTENDITNQDELNHSVEKDPSGTVKLQIEDSVQDDMQKREPILKLSRCGDGSKTIPEVQIDSSDSSLEHENSNDASDEVLSDGWQPESAKKKDAKCRKKQTKVIPTTSGQLAVQTVALTKRVPRTRKHLCQLCGDDLKCSPNLPNI